MRPKLNARKTVIAEFIREYYEQYDRFPSEKNIVDATGIPAGSVHRYLLEMRESGEISYDGSRRSARTIELGSISEKRIMRVLGYVACGPGQEEEEHFIEYIHMPESLIGRGEFFALIAKGKSMVDAGVYPDDYVIVRRQQTAENGEMVIALLEGKNNLKKLVKADDGYILRSMNTRFPYL